MIIILKICLKGVFHVVNKKVMKSGTISLQGRLTFQTRCLSLNPCYSAFRNEICVSLSLQSQVAYNQPTSVKAMTPARRMLTKAQLAINEDYPLKKDLAL